MTDHYQQLVEQFGHLHNLEHAITFLQWDHMVMMPPGGSSSRADAIAELTKLHHDHLTSPLIGELLAEAKNQVSEAEKQSSLGEMERVYSQAICLPPELVKAQSLAASKCEHDWRRQRGDNDWKGFLENFEPVVQLSREEAQARFEHNATRFESRYDAMLDLYCTGDSAHFIAEIFTTLRQSLPEILEQVTERQNGYQYPDLKAQYQIEAQYKLSKTLMTTLGFDFDQGRIDVSAHPFSTGCRGDHRITTRFRENDFFDALQATAHETGHAAYEGGLPAGWDGLPIGTARNLCLHESQSLLFEKQIFLAKPFIRYFSSIIHNHLPATDGMSADTLWRSGTRVEPSYIRVEADEVTYPLHVILRFEIESELINGSLEPSGIPELWNNKMTEYLGLSTENNFKDGCMQDMHWADGAFGYFPSYTIGALNSAQLFNTIRTTFPKWQEHLAAGDISFILQWLRENIWSKGSSLQSQEIIAEATGERTTAKWFLKHLRERYLEGTY